MGYFIAFRQPFFGLCIQTLNKVTSPFQLQISTMRFLKFNISSHFSREKDPGTKMANTSIFQSKAKVNTEIVPMPKNVQNDFYGWQLKRFQIEKSALKDWMCIRSLVFGHWVNRNPYCTGWIQFAFSGFTWKIIKLLENEKEKKK